jgi:hypothetical protein
MSPAENEELRHVTLETLATRFPTAHLASTITRHVRQSVLFKLTEADVVATLEFLRGQSLASSTMDGLGSSKFWQATSKGVLAYERKMNP